MGQLPQPIQTNARDGADREDAHRRLQRAARSQQPFFAAPQIISDPHDRQPFPGNIIPADRLSPNGLAMLNAYPLPTPGFRQGANNAIISSDNPQDQRKDNIRFDYRLNDKNQFSYRYGKYNWVAIDAFRGDVPVRADRLGSAEHRRRRRAGRARSRAQLINEFSLHLRARRGVHQRAARAGPLQAQQVRHQLPVPLPGEQGDPRQDPDDLRSPTSPRSTADRIRPRRADRSTRSPTRRRGSRAATRSRPACRSSTRARTTSTRSTCSRSPAAPTTRTAASSSPTARRREQHRRRHRGRRARAVHQLRGDRPARADEVARARDRPLRPGFVAADAAS